MRRLLLLLGVVIIIGAGVLVVLQSTSAAGQEPARNIRTETIARGDLLLTASATGSVVAERAVRLAFRTPGIVAQVLVEVGDRVEAGQALARLDDTAARLLLEQAEAGLEAAELTLGRALAPPSERDIELAEAAVEAARDAYNALFAAFSADAVRTAELRHQQAVVAADAAEQRRRDTGGQVSTESTTYQLALAQVGQATFAAEIARLQLELLRRGPDSRLVAAAQARIDEAETQVERMMLGLPDAQVQQVQIAVEQARVARDQAQLRIDDHTLRAPFAGIVTQLLVVEGALIIGGVAVIDITDTSHLLVAAQVDEVDIAQVQVGQEVRLSFDALPEEDESITGTVQAIALVATQDVTGTTYEVTIALEASPAAEQVRVGMTASATFVIRDLRNVLRVPNLFVRIDRRTGEAFVNLVLEEETLVEVPIVLGVRADEYSEVLAGLDESDVIGIDLDSDFLEIF